MLWRIQSHQELHERRLARPRRPHKRNRVPSRRTERNRRKRRHRCGRMRKRHLVKLQRQQVIEGHRIDRLRILRRIHNVLEVLQRNFRLTVRPDDRAQLLQRSKNEERIEKQREILPHRNLLAENQVEQKEKQRSPQGVDRRALNETQAAQIANLSQLQLKNLPGRIVQPRDFLLRQSQTLHELDVAQRFGRGPRQRGRLRHNRLLYLLDAPAQHGANPAEQRYGHKEGRSNGPIRLEGVNHDKGHANERGKHNVDKSGNKLLHIRTHPLQLSQSLPAALVLEHGIGQFERMPQSIRVHLGSHLLGDQVHEVILKVLRHPGHKSHAYGQPQKETYAMKEDGKILRRMDRVPVDQVLGDEGVQQRENLVRSRQKQRHDHQLPIPFEITQEDIHRPAAGLVGEIKKAVLSKMTWSPAVMHHFRQPGRKTLSPAVAHSLAKASKINYLATSPLDVEPWYR